MNKYENLAQNNQIAMSIPVRNEVKKYLTDSTLDMKLGIDLSSAGLSAEEENEVAEYNNCFCIISAYMTPLKMTELKNTLKNQDINNQLHTSLSAKGINIPIPNTLVDKIKYYTNEIEKITNQATPEEEKLAALEEEKLAALEVIGSDCPGYIIANLVLNKLPEYICDREKTKEVRYLRERSWGEFFGNMIYAIDLTGLSSYFSFVGKYPKSYFLKKSLPEDFLKYLTSPSIANTEPPQVTSNDIEKHRLTIVHGPKYPPTSTHNQSVAPPLQGPKL